jgi:hypothetical protein
VAAGELQCSPYAQESIDQVASVAYNYGVTLAELNQAPLAEKFITTAIGLMPYTSPEMRQWSRRVENTYLQILQASGTATAGTGTAAPGGAESGIAKLFDYEAAGLGSALEGMAGSASVGGAGSTEAQMNTSE